MIGKTIAILSVVAALAACNSDTSVTNEGAAVVKKAKSIVDALCAAKCGTDIPCIHTHRDAMRALAKELGKTRGNKAHEAQLDAEVVRARTCMKRLLAHLEKPGSGAPPVPAPVPTPVPAPVPTP